MKTYVIGRDTIYCYADKRLRKLIRPLFKVTREFWKQGQYAKEKNYYDKYLIDGRDGKYLTGLHSRVKTYCTKNNIIIKYVGDIEILRPDNNPSLNGVKFRPEQVRAIKRAYAEQRGVIRFATGIGKTIMAAGLISCCPDARVLFFVHTKDLLHQAANRFEKFGFDVGVLGDGKKEIDHKVTVATIQTFARLNVIDMCDQYDIVVVDECHHLNSPGSQYFKVLTTLLAPVKIGLSGKLPRSREQRLWLEGAIGPVIDELNIMQGVERGYLIKPKITLLSIKRKREIADLRRYNDIYRAAIIESKDRNRKIIRAAKRRMDKGKTVLVFVKEVEHGENLYKTAVRMAVSAELLVGKDTSKVRNKVKKLFALKAVKLVITTLWKEGVDIPSLDCCINACGTKSEITIMQFLGRVLRTDKGKTRAEMIDFLDPYKYLSEHTVLRLQAYKKEKLL